VALIALCACSRTELPVKDLPCGNGIVEGAEECDLGDANEDRPAIELLHEALAASTRHPEASGRRPVMPVDRPVSVAAFYDYRSESSHTGFEERDLSVLFLHRDTQTEILGLVSHHGIDEDESGITLPHGLVDLDMTGLPPGVDLAIGDEEREIFVTANRELRGRFEFWRNTDGGALWQLPFPGDWRIDVTVVLKIGINRWAYVLADGTQVALDDELVASLVAHSTPSRCRTDCRIPRCGDDFVDGGEVCDDGNTIDGDGCAADCLSLDR
jgi:cysteine-rich repeat protein